MDGYHREKIDRYCDILVPKINLKLLLPKLIDNGVYNEDDVNMIHWQKHITDVETVKDVYLTVKTRGPDAFRNLLLSLRQTGHEQLACILSGKVDSSSNNNPKIPTSNENNYNGIQNNVSQLNDNDQQSNYEVEESCSKVSDSNFDNYYKIMQTSTEPLTIKVIKATTFRDNPVIGDIERYPMRSNPRGVVLIINNNAFQNRDERTGSELDEANLENLFNQMGFYVLVHRNLKGKEMKKLVRDFAHKNSFSNLHSCFVIVCSHGEQVSKNDNKYATEIQGIDWGEPDYETVTDMDILDNFTTTNCLELAGKPKVFIFQTCRGKKLQREVSRSATDGYDTKIIAASKAQTPTPDKNQLTNLNPKETMRNFSDILVVYSTVPGYVSFRDKVTGSWVINILCEVFMNYAHKLHLCDLLNKVDSRLKELRSYKGDCQTLFVNNIGFNKHCYLNPGLFEYSS